MYGFPTASLDGKTKLLVIIDKETLAEAVKVWDEHTFKFIQCMEVTKTLVTCVDLRIAEDICTVFNGVKSPCPHCPADLNTWVITFNNNQDFCEYLSMSNMADVLYLNGEDVFSVSFAEQARKVVEKLKLIDAGDVTAQHEEKPISDDAWLKDLGITS